MLCQKCKLKQANVFYKKSVNGKTTQLALCEDCAAESGIGFDFGFGKSFMPGLFGSVFGALSAGETDFLGRPGGIVEKQCPMCGTSFSDITHSGKVGCAKCYETFAPELSGTLEGIHGNVKHIGRRPKKHA
jgi:protein arginine kinase activator